MDLPFAIAFQEQNARTIESRRQADPCDSLVVLLHSKEVALSVDRLHNLKRKSFKPGDHAKNRCHLPRSDNKTPSRAFCELPPVAACHNMEVLPCLKDSVWDIVLAGHICIFKIWECRLLASLNPSCRTIRSRAYAGLDL